MLINSIHPLGMRHVQNTESPTKSETQMPLQVNNFTSLQLLTITYISNYYSVKKILIWEIHVFRDRTHESQALTTAY